MRAQCDDDATDLKLPCDQNFKARCAELGGKFECTSADKECTKGVCAGYRARE